MSFVLIPINVALVYLLGAFVNWSLNAGEWSADGRFCIAMFMALAAFCSAMVAAQVEASR